MIYDCFIFNDEYDLLKIRFAELDIIPDLMHVVVQADKTFTGIPKNTDFIWGERVINIFVSDMPDNCDAWTRERFQRDAIMRGLKKCNDDDIIIISDADEIPFAKSVLEFTTDMNVAAFKMNKTGYWLNCIEGYQSWDRAKITTYGNLKKTSPDSIRNSGQDHYIENAGWHFSYVGGIEAINRKLNSFSHTEANTDELKQKLPYKIKTGQSLWGDDFWKIVPIDDSFPKYVQQRQHDSLKKLIHESI